MHSFCCCCTLRDVDVYRPCWVKFGCPTRNDFLESRACGIHREHEEFGAFDSGGELKLRPSNLRHSDSGSCCNLLVPKLHDLQADAVEWRNGIIFKAKKHQNIVQVFRLRIYCNLLGEDVSRHVTFIPLPVESLVPRCPHLMTTVMVIMVSNLDLCYESFGHTAYGSLHVDGIGIGEHVEVAIIFRDGLSAMSLVRSLLEPQKSVWLSMSFDVEFGKNYRVFVVVFWGRAASQNKHPSWQGHSNARVHVYSWLLVSGCINFRKMNLLNSMLTEDLTCMRLSCGTGRSKAKMPLSLPDLRCLSIKMQLLAMPYLNFTLCTVKILEGQWLNCLFGRWSLLLSWVFGGGQCHFKIDAKEGMQLFLRHHLGQCQEWPDSNVWYLFL